MRLIFAFIRNNILFIAFSFLIIFLFKNTIFDDAYMFLRYAYKLESNGLYSWNGDVPTYGCTSILYVFSTFLFLKLGVIDFFGVVNFPAVHSLFYSIIYLYILGKIIDKMILDSSKLILAKVVVFTTSFWFFRYQTGMDTSISMCINALLILMVVYIQEWNWKSVILFCLVSFFSFLCRPDNLIFIIIFPAIFFLTKNEIGIITKYLLIIITLILLLFGLIKLYFGYFFPLPYYVKSSGFYLNYIGAFQWNSELHLWQFLKSNSILFLLILITTQWNRVLMYWIPIFLTYYILSTKIQIMGFLGRYYYPLLPLVIYIFLLQFNSFQIRKSNYFYVARIVLVLMFFSIMIIRINRIKNENQIKKDIVNNYIGTSNNIMFQFAQNEIINMMVELVNIVNDKNFSIGGSEHGRISALCKETDILCLVGLHNNNVTSEKGVGFIDKSLIQFKPDLFWMPHYEYLGLRSDILKSTYFKDEYDYYPFYFMHGIAIRKNSKYKNTILNFINLKYKTTDAHP